MEVNKTKQCWKELQTWKYQRFKFGQQHFLITVYCWSSYFQIKDNLERIATVSMIATFKVQFGRHGILQFLATGNDQDTGQFVRVHKIRQDMAIWSLHHSQCKGKAENGI